MERFAQPGSHDIKASIAFLSCHCQPEAQRHCIRRLNLRYITSILIVKKDLATILLHLESRSRSISIGFGRFWASSMLGSKEDCGVDCSEQNNFHIFNNFLDGFSTLAPSDQMLQIWMFSIIGTILVGLSGLFPLLIIPLESGPALKHGEPAKKLRLMLSFAVGSLLGDVFLHLLPEVWAHIDKGNHSSHTKIGLWVITGLLAFMIVEKLVGDDKEVDEVPDDCNNLSESLESPSALDSLKELRHNEISVYESKSPNGHSHIQERQRKNSAQLNLEKKIDKKSTPAAENKIKVTGYLNLLANVVDNFTHGLAVGASFCISIKVGLATTLAILLHEVPHEVGDFAILLRSGFDWWKAAKAQFLTASGGVFGAVTALTAESSQAAGELTSWILPFTSGGFMYIALVTVVPDLLQEKHGWESVKQVLCICFGVLSMVLVTILFEV